MKRLRKFLLGTILTLTALFALTGVSSVQAASGGPLYLGIVSLRNSGYGYQNAGKRVWKIASYESAAGGTANKNGTIYCIKAGPGFGSSDMSTGNNPKISTYTQKFDIRDLSSIPSPYINVLPTGTNYNKLLWVLDNLYIMPDSSIDNTTARNEFLKAKIPEERYSLLTDDDIDVIQQLAIWHFTNDGDPAYCYNEIELKINSTANQDDGIENYKTFEDLYGDDGWDRQDAASALFDYFINNAPANYSSTYNTTKPVTLETTNLEMKTIGNNYVAGPYKIKQLLNVDYTLSAEYKDTVNNSVINPTLGIKDASGNIVATNKSLKELVGTEFYLMVPTSSNITGINMTINSSYKTKKATYWAVENSPATEQPVVIVEESPIHFSENVSIVVPKPFDLSLRKFITEINGVEIKSRIPQVDTSALKAGTSTTATYEHPKSPVKVAIGDIVTYTIRVYNEASLDGYVEEITDHLPDQLEYIVDDEVNISYGWQLKNSSDLHTVTTAYLSKANETVSGANKIAGYTGGNTLSYKDVKIRCKVVATSPMASKITNIAEITKFTDGNGNQVTDRDSQGSNVNLPTGTDLENYKDSEINRGEPYIPGQQDDDDFEKLVIKSLDLSLRKFITNVNGTEITSRIPQVDTTNLSNGTSTTAIYNHTKAPVKIDLGDTVVYTIRVYNEGEVDGYVEEITDHLPLQLEYLPDNAINVQYGWKMYDENGAETTDVSKVKTIKTKYTGKANETSENANKLLAYDGGKTLNYIDVKVACKVRATDPMASKITNIAEITDFTNGNGEREKDRDSERNNANIPTGKDLEDYKDGELSKSYVPGQEDDDDFEKLIIKDFDLSLRKFITEIDGEKITSRIPQVDITHLANGTATTAIYNHSKEPLDIQIGSIVTYTIRVYNEGDVDGYANEIKDNLPAQLKFLPENEINKKYEWVVDPNNSQIITTNYLSKDNETSSRVNKIPAFDGTTLSYKDVEVVCEVVKTEPMVKKITNIAQISDFVNGNGEEVKDRDSEKDNANIPTGKDLEDYKDNEIDNTYVPGQEDDDDFEKLTVKEFDLSLRKFITAVNETKITSRIPEVDTTNLANGTSTTATYNHPKDPVLVSNGNIVTYTIRVYNEGEIDGYAALIKDDIPEGLEFLPDNELNKSYRWVMLDKDGKETDKLEEAVSIATDYLSKDQEKTTGDNLLKAFDGTTLSYKDVEVAFKVIAPNTSDRIIINQAQISKNTDKNGKDIEDRDSTPDKWIEGEDDQDIEKIKVQYFDLSLRKWVTQAIVIDADGTQNVTETGHKAEDDPEDIVKVDIKKKKIDSVTIKFRYSIRVTNEGQIAGYAKEIKDYIPDGLKFVAEDNPTWTALDEKTIVTDSAKDILLKPGESTEVEVILTWENSAENMKVMDNWAEISKDYNEYGSPDIDSTPNNRKEGEDDIDDAPVLVTVQTGQIQLYLGITFIVLVIVLSGVTLIKKFVL